jgi:glutamate-1-semialdehyde 2,1-aminomutase
MTNEVAARLAVPLSNDSIDTSGVGGTLTGNALAMAAVRATLSSALRATDFDHMVPLATAWTEGVERSYTAVGLPWHVQQLGARAEYWFCPPPRNGSDAAAGIDAELDRFMHLWAMNRGVLMTPFHNMALFSPHHTGADVDTHTAVFAAAVRALTA